jgi:hypothetical protein
VSSVLSVVKGRVSDSPQRTQGTQRRGERLVNNDDSDGSEGERDSWALLALLALLAEGF